VLSPEQIEQIALARKRAGKLRRAIGLARFNGWSYAIAAVLTLVLGLVSTSVWGIVLGVGLTLIAFVELRGAAGLKRLDLQAPRRLALNEAAVGVLLAVYAAWQLAATLYGPNPLTAELAANPDLAGMAGDLEPLGDTVRTMMLAAYAALLAFAILYQGAMALYFATRAAPLRTYAEQTPAWVRDLQSVGAINL
jgi:hypothetical protein